MASNTTISAEETVSQTQNPTDSRAGHFESLLPMLRCLRCKGELGINENGVQCRNCVTNFPVTNGVLRFVESQGYAENFGFEWGKYSRTQLDNEVSTLSERQFTESTGFTPEELKGKWILDIGCGMGRFAEVASRWGANVVGIDLSLAADVAARNLRSRDNV